MDLEAKMKKMGLGHEQGFGAPCLKCKENCEGFELHFWRARITVALFRKEDQGLERSMAQRLGELAALVENPDSVPSTDMEANSRP